MTSISQMIKNKLILLYKTLSPCYREILSISEKINVLNKPHYPSGVDKVKIDDDFTSTKWFVFGYENLADTITKGRKVTFIDIGANEGQSARYAYKFFGEDSTVISYEPLKSCIQYLESVKKIHPKYIYFNKAMNDYKGEIIYNEIGGNGKGITGLSSLLPLKKDYVYFNAKMQNVITSQYNISTTTINDECKFWESFDNNMMILKIDTQGTELKILKPAEEYLASGNIDAIMIEVMTAEKYQGQDNHLEIIKFLEKCGFVIYDIRTIYRERNQRSVGADGWNTGWGNEYDFIFVHRKHIGINK